MNKVILKFLLISLIAGPLSATDLPPIKAGLWNIKSSVDGASQFCAANNTLAKLLSDSKSALKTCSELLIHNSGSVYTAKVTCKIMGSIMTASSIVKGDYSARIVSKTNTSFSPPLLGRSTRNSEEVATYQGPCPIGMQAGDIKLNDGRTINTVNAIKQLPDLSNMNQVVENLQSGILPNLEQMQEIIGQMQEVQ